MVFLLSCTPVVDGLGANPANRPGDLGDQGINRDINDIFQKALVLLYSLDAREYDSSNIGWISLVMYAQVMGMWEVSKAPEDEVQVSQTRLLSVRKRAIPGKDT